MSDLGRQIRNLVDRSAPPISGRDIIRSASAPRRRNWIPGLVAGVAVLVVGAFSFVFGVWQPGDTASETSTTATEAVPPTVRSTTTEAVTTSVVDLVTEPKPIAVDCTGELEAFPCVALLDDDPTTSWQINQGMVGATLTFHFHTPVALESVGFGNLTDDTQFARNARIRGVEISTYDGPPSDVGDDPDWTIGELPDSNSQVHFLEVDSTPTWMVTITITSAYPGRSVGDLEAFTELALAEVVFHGRYYEPELTPSEVVPLITESVTVFGDVDVIVCPGADPTVRTGLGDETLYSTPREALAGWIAQFNGGLGGMPPVAVNGYLEMTFADGREGYAYGLSLGWLEPGGPTEIPLADATFGLVDEQGSPSVGLAPQFVVELRVVPSGESWVIESWEVAGC